MALFPLEQQLHDLPRDVGGHDSATTPFCAFCQKKKENCGKFYSVGKQTKLHIREIYVCHLEFWIAVMEKFWAWLSTNNLNPLVNQCTNCIDLSFSCVPKLAMHTFTHLSVTFLQFPKSTKSISSSYDRLKTSINQPPMVQWESPGFHSVLNFTWNIQLSQPVDTKFFFLLNICIKQSIRLLIT